MMTSAPGSAQPACRPSLVIFDFDGTLADSVGFFRELLPELSQRFRFRLPAPDEQEAMRSRPPREIMKALHIPPWKLALIAMHARRRARDSSAFSLFPGAQGLIGALADHGVPVAIVSSNARDVVARALGPETSRLISAWSCGAAMFGKARHFRSVIRKTRADPQWVVGVGDETRDIEAAREVGITAAAVTWGFAPAGILQASGPDYLFDRFSDLQAFLLARANG